MWLILLMLGGIGTAVFLILTALEQNINLFYTPSQIHAGEAIADRTIRVGGLVVPGSIRRNDSKLEVRFSISDKRQTIDVVYRGILPDLFREGQGIIAEGRLTGAGLVRATTVLAKHDENYMPPEVRDALHASDGYQN